MPRSVWVCPGRRRLGVDDVLRHFCQFWEPRSGREIPALRCATCIRRQRSKVSSTRLGEERRPCASLDIVPGQGDAVSRRRPVAPAQVPSGAGRSRPARAGVRPFIASRRVLDQAGRVASLTIPKSRPRQTHSRFPRATGRLRPDFLRADAGASLREAQGQQSPPGGRRPAGCHA